MPRGLKKRRAILLLPIWAFISCFRVNFTFLLLFTRTMASYWQGFNITATNKLKYIHSIHFSSHKQQQNKSIELPKFQGRKFLHCSKKCSFPNEACCLYIWPNALRDSRRIINSFHIHEKKKVSKSLYLFIQRIWLSQKNREIMATLIKTCVWQRHFRDMSAISGRSFVMLL